MNIYLYNELPGPDVFQIFLMTFSGLLFLFVVFLCTFLINTRGKRIVIDGKLLFFQKKTLLGSTESILVNLETLENVEYRTKTHWFFIGKTLIPIKKYWFVFQDKNGEKQEVSLLGWDTNTLKNMIFFLRGKYPHILWNTHVYKDTPEKLSGLDELMKK